MRRALLCACSDYRDPAFAPLKYPLNDIEAIRHLLEEPELCDFEDVEVLANPAKSEAHEAVERLTADSGQDDLILFYFSGHGKLARDGSVSLVLSDTKENRLHSTGLLDDQLRVLFNASRARKRVIILDCCYSGAVGDEGFKRASDDAVETMAHQIKGTFVLAASTKFQPAMECAESKGSAFTSCLVEGVRTGAAAEKDTGRVTLAKLGEYLAREVPLRSNQQPKFWDFGGVGGTVIAHVPSSFDAAWTEQTLKRLRQMMAREQIDDDLFVELQQVLRSPRSDRLQHRLVLIDDLAQRRIKPVPFLRKWQAIGQAQVEIDNQKEREEELVEPAEVELAEAEREVVEQEVVEQEVVEQEVVEQEGEDTTDPQLIEEVHLDQSQPLPKDSPEIVEPPKVSGVDAAPYSNLMDENWQENVPHASENGTESVEELPDESETTATFLQVAPFDFALIGISLLIGFYVIARDIHYEDIFYIIVPLLLITLWFRLWNRIEGVIGKIFFSISILSSSYICAIYFEDDYFFLDISGVTLVAFSIILAFHYWHMRHNQTSQT